MLDKREYFLPRDVWFWVAHLVGWIFFLTPSVGSAIILESYNSQVITADLTRFTLTLPVLLIFRYLYNRYEWHLNHPFELLSLVVGFNFITAFAVAYFVQHSVWLTHEVFAWFETRYLVTTRDPDELQISWINSLAVQLAWCLIYMVVKSSGRNQRNELERMRTESRLKDAQINTLMGQISPHFLFNGMNNIITLMDEDIPKAQRSLRAFSDMLRFSLKSHAQEKVSLQEELQMVNNYIAIASIQLEDKLRYKQRVPKAALSLFVPPMILQMLVENAIKHGIALQKKGGELSVLVSENKQELICLVSNDGVLADVGADEGALNTGLGVQNIRQRLELLYGARGRLDLVQEGDKVVAEVHIPREMC